MGIHNQLLGADPDLLVPVVAPVLQALSMDLHLAPEKVNEIIGAFAQQLNLASTKAMAGLAIMKGE